MAFIEKLDARALNLSPEEFQRFMQRRTQHSSLFNYTDTTNNNTSTLAANNNTTTTTANGETLLPSANGPKSLSKGQQRGLEVRARLEDLKGRQERVQKGALSLQQQLQRWVRDIHLQLDRVYAAHRDDLTATEVRADDDVVVVQGKEGSGGDGDMLVLQQDEDAQEANETDC